MIRISTMVYLINISMGIEGQEVGGSLLGRLLFGVLVVLFYEGEGLFHPFSHCFQLVYRDMSFIRTVLFVISQLGFLQYF